MKKNILIIILLLLITIPLKTKAVDATAGETMVCEYQNVLVKDSTNDNETVTIRIRLNSESYSSTTYLTVRSIEYKVGSKYINTGKMVGAIALKSNKGNMYTYLFDLGSLTNGLSGEKNYCPNMWLEKSTNRLYFSYDVVTSNDYLKYENVLSKVPDDNGDYDLISPPANPITKSCVYEFNNTSVLNEMVWFSIIMKEDGKSYISLSPSLYNYMGMKEYQVGTTIELNDVEFKVGNLYESNKISGNNNKFDCPEKLAIDLVYDDYLIFNPELTTANSTYTLRLRREDDIYYTIDYGVEEKNCESLLGHPETPNSPAYFLAFVFRVMKYIGIIILIALSIADFFNAITSQDEKALNKAFEKMLKRAILCAILFVLPTLVEFVLQLVNENTTTCGIGK